MKTAARPIFWILSEDPSVRLWMKNQLSHAFLVLEAFDGGEVLEALGRTSPFAVAIDARAEEYDPSLLCQKIKKISPLLPILWITGALKKSSRKIALQAGAFDFLTHPLDPRELQDKIALLKKGEGTRQKMSQLSSSIPSLEEGSFPSFGGEVKIERSEGPSLEALPLFASAKERNIPLALLLIEVREEGKRKEVIEELRSHLPQGALLLTVEEGRGLLIAPAPTLQAAATIGRNLQKRETASPFWIALTLLSPEEGSFHSAYEKLALRLKNKGGSTPSHLLIVP